jgi:hypothetical protein
MGEGDEVSRALLLHRLQHYERAARALKADLRQARQPTPSVDLVDTRGIATMRCCLETRMNHRWREWAHGHRR